MDPDMRIQTYLKSISVLVSIMLLVTGCATRGPETIAETPYRNDLERHVLLPDGMRIGLLADSRFQTAQSMHGAVFSRQQHKELIANEELRPPALGHLAPDMLEYFLKRLIDEEHVDIIFYLGNIANNGCTDEVRAAFDVLRKYRDGLDERAGKRVPIFYVIGNHDYLGAGRTPHTPDRNVYCYDRTVSADSKLNTPQDKYELITRIHDFNIGNFNAGTEPPLMSGWRYSHNYDRQRIQTACVVRDKGRYQHEKAGCYYAAKLTYEDGSEILLVDSSDYYDHGEYADLKLSTRKWYGLTGWVSTVDGTGQTIDCDNSGRAVLLQAQWFACQQGTVAPPVRIIVSHYPLRSLSPIGRPIAESSDVVCQLASLFRPRPVNGNYWFAADTHVRPYFKRDLVRSGSCINDRQREIEVSTLNIGSTVDYDHSLAGAGASAYENIGDMSFAVDYEPGAVVAGIVAGAEPTDQRIAARLVRVDVRTCGAVITALRNQPDDQSPVYVPVRGMTDYRKLFGLDSEYRNPDWSGYDELNSMRNLDELVQYLTTKFAHRADLGGEKIRACIALESSRLAGGLQTSPFDCESCPPWRRMRQLEEQDAVRY